MKRKQPTAAISDEEKSSDVSEMEAEDDVSDQTDNESMGEADNSQITTPDDSRITTPDDSQITTPEESSSLPDEPAAKMAKMTKGALYKPPTNDEMNQLKETENLFHSSLFRMQITELLSEVCLKAKRRQDMDTAVKTVQDTVTNIEQGAKYELQDTSWLKQHDIAVPFLFKPAEVRGSFQFFPPTEVKVTGSFVSQTCAKPQIAVDLLVTMPKACIDSKDFMNQRYFRKRALYLCVIANNFLKNDSFTDIKFSFLHGNQLKPILHASVKVSGRKAVPITIQVVPEEGTFKLNRFHVWKNNVRSQWYSGSTEDSNSNMEQGAPTPFYNCSMLEDLTAVSSMKQMEQLLSSSQGLKDGIVLLKIWLKQRELDKGYGGFSSHVLTMYVLYLLSVNKLNSLMSSYQVFRNTLLRLSESNLSNSGISMCTVTDDENMPSLNNFHEQFDVVFIDTTGYYNYCYMVQKSVYNRVKHEAVLGMDILNDRHIDSFEKLFMKKVTFTQKFDHIFHIKSNVDLSSTVKKLGVTDKLIDCGGHVMHACVSAIVDKLEHALSQRVDLLQIVCQEPALWSVSECPPSYSDCTLTVGLMLNPEFAFNVLDRGPSADSSEADEFRKFWGNKSELRRFQDGGICEAVLWSNKASYAQKQVVCETIIKYTLLRHAEINDKNINYFAKQTDEILTRPPAVNASKKTKYGTAEEVNSNIIHMYDELCKQLRKLSDLPLTINSIQGVSECFRCTEVFPTLPCTFQHQEKIHVLHGVKRYVPSTNNPCPLYTPSLKVTCMLEPSGKWPNDIEALKRLKAAFHIQLANALKNQFNLPIRATPRYVDVLKNNYVFRITLAYTGEIGLLKTVHAGDGKLLKRDTEEALKLEREIVALPRLTSILHGLQQQHPSYSTTTRLAKRWISAHMMCDYIEPIAVELLCASLYLSPAPFQPPRSGLCGFQRFLELLSTFDWKISPLLINLNNEFTDADLAEIPTRFSKERTTLPLMFISTPLDKYSSHWTKQKPSANILQRLVLLAVRSLDNVQQQILQQDQLDLKPIFRPSLSMYDVLIHLDVNQLPRRFEGLDFVTQKNKPLFGKPLDDEKFPVTDFNPAQLLIQELKRTFDDLALFFHDNHGGTVIGVLWKPSALEAKEFKVSHINYSELSTQPNGNMKLISNMKAVLEDIKLLGKGVISKIETN